MDKKSWFGLALELLKIVLFISVLAAGYMMLKDYFQPSLLTTQHEYLIKKQAAPFIEYSANREAMRKRDELFADPEQVSTIFLFQDGQVVQQFEIKGGVTSLNTKYVENANPIYPSYVPNNDGTIDQGSSEGVFFFTTDDQYVEWKGDYLLDTANEYYVDEEDTVLKKR